MNNYNVDYETAFHMAKELYLNRMAKHIDDGLITSNYGITEANRLLTENMKNMELIETMLTNEL